MKLIFNYSSLVFKLHIYILRTIIKKRIEDERMNETEVLDITPNASGDLKRIHTVITRGLQVSIQTTQEIMYHTTPDPQYLDGFLDFLHSLTSILHAHHLTEDDVAFPLFKKKSLPAPYTTLSNDHTTMQRILQNLDSAIEKIRSQGQNDITIQYTHDLLQNLQELWRPHIQSEESCFTEHDINACFTAEEQHQMSMQFTLHATKNSGPDYLVVPFMVYNLIGDDRRIMLHLLPAIVTQELLPGAWKHQWAPMKPFLLG